MLSGTLNSLGHSFLHVLFPLHIVQVRYYRKRTLFESLLLVAAYACISVTDKQESHHRQLASLLFQHSFAMYEVRRAQGRS